jgi:hypothetical protein
LRRELSTAGDAGGEVIEGGEVGSATSNVVLVTGSRWWRFPRPVIEILEKLPIGVLRHGDAPGLDRMAALLAEQRGWEIDPVKAEWEIYGQRRAGHLRNIRQAYKDPPPWICVAFPSSEGSPGTWDQIQICEEAGIPIVVVGIAGWQAQLDYEIRNHERALRR